MSTYVPSPAAQGWPKCRRRGKYYDRPPPSCVGQLRPLRRLGEGAGGPSGLPRRLVPNGRATRGANGDVPPSRASQRASTRPPARRAHGPNRPRPSGSCSSSAPWESQRSRWPTAPCSQSAPASPYHHACGRVRPRGDAERHPGADRGHAALGGHALPTALFALIFALHLEGHRSDEVTTSTWIAAVGALALLIAGGYIGARARLGRSGCGDVVRPSRRYARPGLRDSSGTLPKSRPLRLAR